MLREMAPPKKVFKTFSARAESFSNRFVPFWHNCSRLFCVVVVLASANAFLAPVTQRPATIMQAATIAAKDVSALRKASGASQCTHEEVPSIATVVVSHRFPA